MGRTGNFPVQWNKSAPKRQVPHVFSHLWNLGERKDQVTKVKGR